MWRYSETYQCLWLCIFSKNSLWHRDTVIRRGRCNCSATRNRTTACLLNLKTFIIRLKQDIHKWLDSCLIPIMKKLYWFKFLFMCAHFFIRMWVPLNIFRILGTLQILQAPLTMGLILNSSLSLSPCAKNSMATKLAIC